MTAKLTELYADDDFLTDMVVSLVQEHKSKDAIIVRPRACAWRGFAGAWLTAAGTQVETEAFLSSHAEEFAAWLEALVLSFGEENDEAGAGAEEAHAAPPAKTDAAPVRPASEVAAVVVRVSPPPPALHFLLLLTWGGFFPAVGAGAGAREQGRFQAQRARPQRRAERRRDGPPGRRENARAPAVRGA